MYPPVALEGACCCCSCAYIGFSTPWPWLRSPNAPCGDRDVNDNEAASGPGNDARHVANPCMLWHNGRTAFGVAPCHQPPPPLTRAPPPGPPRRPCHVIRHPARQVCTQTTPTQSRKVAEERGGGARERESEIERQRDRETERQRDRETERQREREGEGAREGGGGGHHREG